MLFIYGALPVGGIETFFVRMAKERFNKNLSTSILLLSKPEQSNQELLAEMKKYANVIFPDEIFYGSSLLCSRLPLLFPLKQKIILNSLKEVDQIHVFDGLHALLGYRITKQLNRDIPITIGFYHYIKYLWGGNKVAWHEKVNRKFVFNYLPEESLLFFSEGNRDLYIKHKQQKFEKSKTFRLGVIDKKDVILKGDFVTPLKIAAVGRLVEFKTYNFYMIDVVKKLIDKGVDVKFDIYGDGPLKKQVQEKINKANLQDKIILKGTLDYSRFDSTVSSYDLFIGSGTAIIQASSLGVPCITGVENVIEPKTYGYFCDVWQHEYNLKGLELPLFNVEDVIYDFVNKTEIGRKQLKESHINCIDAFTNESCQNSMDALKSNKLPNASFKFNRWIYELSRVADRVNMRFNSRHSFNTRHKDLKK